MIMKCRSGDGDELEINADPGASLTILQIGHGPVDLSDEDESALLEILIDRAGGLQNLWTEATCSFTRIDAT